MARIFAWIAALVVSFAFCSIGFAAETARSTASAAMARQPAVGVASGPAELFELATRYEHGEGVAQSYEHALALYCDAARRGESRAFFSLGWMFLHGRGVPHDEAIAVAWLRKAADRGTEQAANLLRLMPSQAASAASGCPAIFVASAKPIAAPAKIRDLVARTAQELDIDPQLVMAVIAVESAFNPRAVSPKNAQGLMQLMPETAARFGVRDPFDAKENVRGGTTYLRELLTRFDGDLVLALAAYNAGEGAILSNGGVPPYRETRDYIERVTRLCACNGPEF
jgi:hypothetical protein